MCTTMNNNYNTTLAYNATIEIVIRKIMLMNNFNAKHYILYRYDLKINSNLSPLKICHSKYALVCSSLSAPFKVLFNVHKRR